MRLNPPLQDLGDEAAQSFRASFNRAPDLTASAPGRVNLMGEHVDYCDGLVLPFAIDRHLVIAAALNDLDVVRLSSGDNSRVEIPITSPIDPGKPLWTNYVRGVMRGFQNMGHAIPGFDARIVSSIPTGAGLSSSAALELATATLLEGLLDTVLPTRDKALLCRQAEHDFAGVPCGIMDQFASAFGRRDQLVLIDCQSGEPELIPFSNPDLTVIIANTMVSHQLGDSGYGTRRRETEDALAHIGKSSWRDVAADDLQIASLPETLARRARHVVTEIERTRRTVQAFESRDCGALEALFAGSHASLRDDFEVSCRELDLMVDVAAAIGHGGGVLGSRMTGGGFGGSTVTLCESRHAEQIAATLASEYQEATGISPEIFATRPVDGAHLI